MIHSPESEANQGQSEPVKELDEKEPKEDHAVLMKKEEDKTFSSNTSFTNEPQCDDLAIGACEHPHPHQLPQEWCKTSECAFKHQEKEIGDTESTTALEEKVLTSDIKDELEDDPESMMPPKKTLHDILKDSRRRIMKVSKMYKCIRTISNTR